MKRKYDLEMCIIRLTLGSPDLIRCIYIRHVLICIKSRILEIINLK